MRHAPNFLVLSTVLAARPVPAEENAGDRLYGSWHLVTFRIKVVGEEGAPKDVFGPHPFGRLILTPEHYMAVFTSGSDRKPPTNQAEAAALLSSMTAYTGRFRVEGDKFITTVDGAWNEFYKGTEQVRFFTVDGDKLSIRTAGQPSGILPGKITVSTLVWERER
jgi:hypothetical protein